MHKLDKFTESYLESALWSSSDSEGDPLDDKYSIDDLAPETLERAKADVDDFLVKAGALLDSYDDSIAVHDFWLTRNRHGAGFWDGDYEEADGKALTDLSHAFGELYLYVGDDGKLYFS